MAERHGRRVYLETERDHPDRCRQPNQSGPVRHIISVGDFNHDGRSDILWQNSSGEAAIWEVNGTTAIAAVSLGNPGPDWHIMGTGYYNHDGRSDILWQNSSGEVVIWEMNGTMLISNVSLANPVPPGASDRAPLLMEDLGAILQGDYAHFNISFRFGAIMEALHWRARRLYFLRQMIATDRQPPAPNHRIYEDILLSRSTSLCAG